MKKVNDRAIRDIAIYKLALDDIFEAIKGVLNPDQNGYYRHKRRELIKKFEDESKKY